MPFKGSTRNGNPCQGKSVSVSLNPRSLLTEAESEERSRETHDQAMREARQNMISLTYEWDNAVLRRAELVLRHKKALERIREAHLSIIEAEICLIEALSDIQGLKDRNRHIMERVEAEKQTLQQATEEAARTRERGRQLADEVQGLLAEEEDKRDLFAELSAGKDPETMEIEIDAEAAKLDLIQAANPNVMRDFERRAAEIARLSRKMEGVNEKLDGIKREINDLMAKWEPSLDELVSQINDAFAYNFEQISCAGEVRVHKDEEDFDAWALDIMVRFRYV